MKKIIVVGSFVMDQVANVDEFPVNGQTIIGRDLNVFPGGKGANQAVSAARQGAKVEMMGVVGNDTYGETFLQILNDEKIEGTHILRSDCSSTALGLILIDKEGENRIIVVPGANHDKNSELIMQLSSIITPECIVVLQLELIPQTTFEIIEICDQHRATVILNPAPAVHIPSEILSKVTYFIPNESELTYYSGIKVHDLKSAEEASIHLRNLGVKNIIATLGSKGALIVCEDGITHSPGIKVNVIDTVGAGDSFVGAFAAKIAEGVPLKEAVDYANKAGALAVTRSGAIPSIPYKHEIINLTR